MNLIFKSIPLLLFLLFSPILVLGQNGLILKNADSMIRNDKQNNVELKGNVELIFKQQFVSADSVFIDLNKKTMNAKGNVIIATPTTYLEASKVLLNYKTNKGVLYDAHIQNGQISFDGKIVYRKTENDYEILDASYTACTNCAPSWSFKGKTIDANLNGTAKISNATLHLKDFPVFWLPYVVFPLNSNRQSGMLFPIFGGYPNGVSLEFRYFQVHNDQADSMYSFKTYSTRGIKGKYNYRYKLSPVDEGELNISILNDREFADYYSDINSAFNDSSLTRWMLTYNHRYELPKNIIQRTNLRLASDTRYSVDFSDELDFNGAPSLRNDISLTRNLEKTHASLEVQANKNLLKDDPLDSNADAVHRFPELRWEKTMDVIGETNLFFKNASYFSNFSRPNYAFDRISSSPDPSVSTGDCVTDFNGECTYYLDHNGEYNPGQDLIRTGQRLVLNPEVFYPINIADVLEVLPSVGVKTNFYQFGVAPPTSQDLIDVGSTVDESSSGHQLKLQTKVAMRSRFSKIYGDESSIDAYRHEMVPRIIYRQTPLLERSKHSFFNLNDEDFLQNNQSISDLDLNQANGDSIQFDYQDQFIDERSIQLGIDNILVRRTKDGTGRKYNEILFWELYQSYDFKDSDAPLSDITSITQLNLNNWAIFTEFHYYPYQNKTSTNARVRYNFLQNSYAQIAYERSFDIRNAEEFDPSTIREDVTLSNYYRSSSLNFGSSIQYSIEDQEIKNYKFGLQLQPEGACWRFSLVAIQPTGGEVFFTGDFQLQFNGLSWSSKELRKQLEL
ncbi:MAG: LPS-assembly protein LptD [Bdellovibrionales bacterium]